MEKPNDAYNAGKAGTGSRNGLTINQIATGTELNSKTGDKGRGASCILGQKMGAETRTPLTQIYP
jgi:hypothetical protein